MTQATTENLRTEAMFLWLLSEHRLEAADLKKRHPQFADVTVETLKGWAREDAWGKKRDELYTALTARLDKRVLEEIHKDRKESLALLRDLLDIARTKLADAPVKSFEGVIRSLAAVVTTIEALNKAAAGSIPEIDAPAGEQAGLIVLPLTEASSEAIDAAKTAYLAARRRQFKQAVEEHDAEAVNE